MLSGTEILTSAQMRAIESAAIASGQVTGLELMERAGTAVAGQIRLRWPKPGRATVLCGPGNNGGDGYVVARHLHRAGWRVRVLGMDNTPGPDAAEMKRRWAETGPIRPLTEDELRRRGESSDVYVDAIFGIGLTRPPEGEIADILLHMGSGGGDWGFYQPRIVAVDCPSGLCMDSGAFLGQPREGGEFDLRCRLTIAFDSPKPGHLLERGPDCCGELVVADIGLRAWRRSARPATRWVRTEDVRQTHLPHHNRSLVKYAGHKFDYGHALVVAGSIGQGGAARLSARAALRVGAGLVTICPPKSAMSDHAVPPDAIMRRGIDDADALRRALGDPRVKAICIGPGCGIRRAANLLPSLLASRRPCVLDADAITALARIGMAGLHDGCVLTPHIGEFARLFPDLAEKLAGPKPPPPINRANFDLAKMRAHHEANEAFRKSQSEMRGPLYSKVNAARDAAARCGAVVLLKGPDTVIAAPPPIRRPGAAPRPGRAVIYSAFDVPWLATAGSGDVLAGIITGLLARGLPPLDAAATGAWLHAAAARRFGPGLIADDLPEQIPDVFRDLGL